MVPPFKEAVEACFVAGLVKVVFATETLALGINMPARTVVIEKLTKFTGERHEFLTPGPVHPAHRAGRPAGHRHRRATPSCCGRRSSSFGEVAGAGRQPQLRAHARRSGRPTTWPPTWCAATPADQAHHLLNLSFAQFQADQAVVRLETRLARREPALAEAAGRGRRASGATSTSTGALVGDRAGPAGDRPAAGAEPVERRPWRRLRPGDVIQRPGRQRRRAGCAVLTVARRKGGAVRLRVHHPAAPGAQPGAATTSRDRPEVVGTRRRCPMPFAPDDRGFQQEVAEELRELAGRTPRRPAAGAGRGADGDRRPAATPTPTEPAAGPPGGRLPRPRPPPAGRPPGRAHRRARSPTSTRQIRGRTESLARRFDQVLQLLEALGLPRRLGAHRAGRAAGAHLPRVATCSSPRRSSRACSTASTRPRWPALVSCFTYEHRSSTPAAAAVVPVGQRASTAFAQIEPAGRRAQRRRGGARACRSPGRPIPAFLALAHAWAAGRALDEVLDDEELSGGDFVRNAKLLIDLLRQIADAAADPATAPRRPPGRRRACSAAWWLGRRRWSPTPEPMTVDRPIEPVERRAVTIEKGEAWGAPGRCRPTASSCAPTPRPGPWSSEARRGGEPLPDARAARRRPVPHARRPGRRGPPAVGRGHDLPRRPRRRPCSTARRHWFVAHLVARRSWWRGRVVAAMNAQWLGAWDLGPRSHPDDGLLDVTDGTLPLGDRLKARRRLPDRHPPPHPGAAPSPGPPRSSSTSTRRSTSGSTASGSAAAGASRSPIEPDALRVVV